VSTALPPHQFALLKAVADSGAQQPEIEQLAESSGVDQAKLSAAAVELERDGLCEVLEREYLELKLTDLGRDIANGRASLPERKIARAIRHLGGRATIKELMAQPLVRLSNIEPGRYARNLVELGWAAFDKGSFELVDAASHGDPPQAEIEYAIHAAAMTGGGIDVVPGADSRIDTGVAALKPRKEIATVRERTRRMVKLTDAGEDLAVRLRLGEVTELVEASELTPEMLENGAWRSVQFRAYDVTLAAERVTPGKAHPMARLIEEVRGAFLALGFSEADCPMVTSAFWDFDALFQPQDHPARDMQDTFYIGQPSRYELPEAALVERVKSTHESGGTTGSLGWRYQWSEERARQVVLRTHMTASSIHAVAEDPHAPRKVFSIGRVFRRETVDSTHLPEFTQVDGIIIDDRGSLASLLGTLATFYDRMGIQDIKMKPAFFPYTEPSVEVHIKWAGKWMEMGGAGIFRPEVTEPFGCRAPVLAWGLGLERLAMARFGLTSIKDLYLPRLDWLKNVPLSG
jgi:phenylalanyl-tRNA synthetase alpha chain